MASFTNINGDNCGGCLLQVSVFTINPLALTNDEMYGSFDGATHEWRDGILARIMRTTCKDDSPDQKWILFDGPVDTLWIESMNTLLDDNKLLTLLSGERISMSPQVRKLDSNKNRRTCHVLKKSFLGLHRSTIFAT